MIYNISIYPARAPKGLRAESAGAVTDRRCPHSGEGEDFLTGQGGKLTVMPRAKNGLLTKIEVVWKKSDFWTKNRIFGPKKRGPLLRANHVLATTKKVVQRKKVPLPK